MAPMGWLATKPRPTMTEGLLLLGGKEGPGRQAKYTSAHSVPYAPSCSGRQDLAHLSDTDVQLVGDGLQRHALLAHQNGGGASIVGSAKWHPQLMSCGCWLQQCKLGLASQTILPLESTTHTLLILRELRHNSPWLAFADARGRPARTPLFTHHHSRDSRFTSLTLPGAQPITASKGSPRKYCVREVVG